MGKNTGAKHSPGGPRPLGEGAAGRRGGEGGQRDGDGDGDGPGGAAAPGAAHRPRRLLSLRPGRGPVFFNHTKCSPLETEDERLFGFISFSGRAALSENSTL